MSSRPFSGPARSRGGYGAVETAIVVIAVTVLIVVVANHYARNIREARKTALKSELATFRNTLNLYSALKGRCPESLRELFKAKFVIPYKAGPLAEFEGSQQDLVRPEKNIVFRPEYLEAYARDEEGNILDPFGLPYAYDPVECTVHSRKPGFEDF